MKLKYGDFYKKCTNSKCGHFEKIGDGGAKCIICRSSFTNPDLADFRVKGRKGEEGCRN